MISRREILRRAGNGFGLLALRGLLAAEDPLAVQKPHFPARARRVIFLFMHGGPSHLDTFDPKPELSRMAGKPLPFRQPLTFAVGQTGGLLPSPWKFRQYGQCGAHVSELFPNVAGCVDDLCILRGMVGDSVAHGGAIMQLHTGSNVFTRPSMGSWTVFGLGSENRNLPGYITLKPTLFHGGAKNWSSAFLPAAYEGTAIGHAAMNPSDLKQPIRDLKHDDLTPGQHLYEMEMLQKINRRDAERNRYDPQLEGRIQAFELAFRMQTSAQEAFDIGSESPATRKLYGVDEPETSDLGWQCLVARRLAERGVRFIQVSHTYRPGNDVGWDAHQELVRIHTRCARQVDLPVAGLLRDLKGRGLLKDTLVIWGGEFGRTPIAQAGDGRDHNPYGYTMWMAGGGVKAGLTYGATDDFGYHAVTGRMHVHDLHATILHILGLDHQRLTFRYAGRNFRLTDVAGNVAHPVLA